MSFFDTLKHLITLSFPIATTRNEELSQLDKDQKKCYEKIVTYLLDCCKENIERKNQSAHHQINGRQFMIVFRQSEKWEEVRKQLEKIEKKNISWVTTWLNHLNHFKSSKSDLIEKKDSLYQVKKELQLSQIFQNQPVIFNPEQMKIQKKLYEIQEEITNNQSTLNQIRQTVSELIDNTENLIKNLQLDQDCINFLQFVQENALELKSSMQWSNDPSDLQKLFVDIQEKPEQKKENSHHLEVTSRVHFLIEEKLEENRISFQLQETNFSILFANDKLKDSFFWISPGRQPSSLRRSSSLAIIDENYSEIQSDELIDDCSVIPPDGYRIKKVVDLALDYVNKCLASNDLEGIAAISALNLTNHSVIYIKQYSN